MFKTSRNKDKQRVAYYKKDGDRPLTDNSKKYEISSDSDEEPPDFNYLIKLSQNTSAGSHFVFKGEHEKYQGEGLTTQFSKYFNVDTTLLNLAIKAIPFHERHNISGIEWSSEEINNLTSNALSNEREYREKLEEKKFEKVTEKAEKLKIEEPQKEQTAPAEPPKSDDKKSMEKWLDDILDL